MQNTLIVAPLAALCILAGCASHATEALSADTIPAEGRLIDYRCKEIRFTAQFWPDRVVLHMPSGDRVLPPVARASGAKYQRGEMLFWSKGSDAVLIDGTRSYTDCRVDSRGSSANRK